MDAWIPKQIRGGLDSQRLLVVIGNMVKRPTIMTIEYTAGRGLLSQQDVVCVEERNNDNGDTEHHNQQDQRCRLISVNNPDPYTITGTVDRRRTRDPDRAAEKEKKKVQ
jgi:hypothetical protein